MTAEKYKIVIAESGKNELEIRYKTLVKVMKYFLFYLLIINIITFLIYGMDKYKAKKHIWRISEKVLIGLATIGGFIGAFAGMQVFRHKTKHIKFVIGVPLIAALWCFAIVYYWVIKY